MYRLLLVLGILIFVKHSVAQEIEVKHDSAKFSSSKKRALIYKGKKVALYDLEKEEYVIKPTKKTLIYPFHDLVDLEVYGHLKNDEMSMILFRGDEKFEINEKRADTLEVYRSTFDMEFNYPGVIGVNKRAFLMDSMKYVEYVPFNDHKLVGFKKVTENHLIIMDYAQLDEKFISSTEEEEVVEGHTKSGVWDLENDQWLIPNKYEEINRLNNYYICSFRYGVSENQYGNPDAQYYYDVYDSRGTEIQSQTERINEKELAKILQADDVKMCRDSLHYIIKKGNKKGLVRFQLFGYFFGKYPKYDYQEILPPEFDHLVFSPETRKVLTLSKEKEKPLAVYQYIDGDMDENWGVDEARMIVRSGQRLIVEQSVDGNERIITDEEEYMYVSYMSGPMALRSFSEKEVEDSLSVYFENYDFDVLHKSFGFNGYFNNLVSVIDIKEEYTDPERLPLVSIQYPGEDSIDNFGNVVYPPPWPGHSHSGVYDFSNDKWKVLPQYLTSLVGLNGIYFESEHDAVAIDHSGNRIESSIKERDLMEFAPFMIGNYKTDKVIKAPNGMNSHMKERSNQVYFYVDDKIGLANYSLFSPFYGLNIVAELCDFVHYNPDGNFYFFVKDDSVIFKNKDWQYTAPEGTTLEYVDYFGSPDESAKCLRALNENDTTVVFQNFEPDENGRKEIAASIVLNDDRLILNDRSKIDDQYHPVDPDYFWGGDIILNFILENEASAIWEKKDSNWKKQTPYYAMVDPVPAGYIVKTGKYLRDGLGEEEAYDGFPEVEIKAQSDSRYILLDQDLNPYVYMDMYDFEAIEDLGFGLSIKTSSGKFFVDNNGKAITSNEWQWFELEDGKLKAGRDDVYEINEWGEPAINAEGQIIYLQKAAVKYFDLN